MVKNIDFSVYVLQGNSPCNMEKVGFLPFSKKLYEKRPSRFEKYLRSGKEAKVLHVFYF